VLVFSLSISPAGAAGRVLFLREIFLPSACSLVPFFFSRAGFPCHRPGAFWFSPLRVVRPRDGCLQLRFSSCFWSSVDRVCSSSAPARSSGSRILIALCVAQGCFLVRLPFTHKPVSVFTFSCVSVSGPRASLPADSTCRWRSRALSFPSVGRNCSHRPQS
jgi:hypothetical protein